MPSPMAGAWPTGGDVAYWMRNQGFTVDDDDALDVVAAAATDDIVDRCDAERLDAVAPLAPEPVRLAIMMRSAALYIRRDSPGGIVQVSADNVIRVNRYDGDIDRLLTAWADGPDPVCG